MVTKAQINGLAIDPAINLTTSSVKRVETEARALRRRPRSKSLLRPRPRLPEAEESPITRTRASETPIMGKLDEISSDAAPAEARDFVFGQHPGEPKNAPPRVEATAPPRVEATAPKLETTPEPVQNAEEVPPLSSPRHVGDTRVRHATALRASP